MDVLKGTLTFDFLTSLIKIKILSSFELNNQYCFGSDLEFFLAFPVRSLISFAFSFSHLSKVVFYEIPINFQLKL